MISGSLWSPAGAARLLVGAALCGALAVPGAADARVAPAGARGGPELSSRLRELATPKVRAQTTRRQSESVGLTEDGPGSLLRDGGRVVVTVRFAADASAGAGRLRGAGAEVLHVSPRYDTVTASVAPADLPAVADVAGVRSVVEVLTPLVQRAPTPAVPAGDARPAMLAAQTCRGARTSAGDVQMRAAEARRTFGVNGAGTTVGVLSDSFDAAADAPDAAADVSTADLPGPGNPCGFLSPTTVLQDSPNNQVADEGRAMAQIVHDLAPGAHLQFASAFLGQQSFADNIRRLKTAGSDVIVDDVSYFAEPFYQDGPIGAAVNDVTAGPDGVPYFSSAGNNNVIDAQGRNISSWESPAYRPTGGCPALLTSILPGPNETNCEDFDPNPGVTDQTFGITVAPGRTLRVDLQWAQPWYGVTTDIDLYILTADGSGILGASESANAGPTGTQTPFEITGYTNDTAAPVTVQVVINRPVTPGEANSGDTGTPRLKFIMANNDEESVTASEYPTSTGGDVVGPTIFGQSGAGNAVSVAAMDVRRLGQPEIFSSRGPRTVLFGPVNGTTPAPPLAQPQVLAKPDLTASDCGDNTRFGGTFCGTSAAAPHAAAVAALALDADPTATRGDVVGALTSTADPIGAFGPAAVGAGFVDAVGALGALASPAPVDATETPFFATTGSIANSDASQGSRLARDGQASGCDVVPAAAAAAGSLPIHYDAYDFTNLTNEDQCVRVELTAPPQCRSAPNDLYSATYVPGYFPWAPASNAKGLSGLSPITDAGVGYFVRVPPGSPYTVVVNEISSGAGCSSYGLQLDAVAPYALERPGLAGSAQVGAPLTASTGRWNGGATFAYAWQRCNSIGRACGPIAGATGPSYVPVAADLGSTLRATVSASGGGRTSSADSAVSAVVATPPAPPVDPPTAPPAPPAPLPPAPPVVVPPTVTVPPKTPPKAVVRRSVMRLTGPRRPRAGVRSTYRILVRAEAPGVRARAVRGQSIRITVDGKRRVSVRTDRLGRARFSLRLRRGSHRILLVPVNRTSAGRPATVVRSLRVR